MKKRLSKKQIVILVIAVIATSLVGWWGWWQFGPKPLGDRLEYLGKGDYGCLWICDSEPGSEYYYGTDMSLGEVVEYFKGKGYSLISTTPGSGSNYNFDSLLFENLTHSTIDVNFYYNTDNVVTDFDLHPNNKKNIVSLDSIYYFKAL